MCLYMSVYWKDRARVCVCVCVGVSHTKPDIHNSAEEEGRPKAADKHIIMILCVVDVKTSGLSNHWIVKQRTEPGGKKTTCNFKSSLRTCV